MSVVEHIGVLIGIPEIAEIAGVQRTAVSNWRKRNLDFPAPVIETPSGLLFDLGEIEGWLIENGKISQRVPIASIVWPVLDAMRGDLSLEEHSRFISAALVYLEVSDRVGAGRLPQVDQRLTWPAVRLDEADRFLDALQDAAIKIETVCPQLQGSIAEGLLLPRDASSHSVMRALDLLERATSENHVPRSDLFEEMRDRIHERARFSEESSTPLSVGSLMAKLAVSARSIMDPACGEASVLLMSACSSQSHATRPRLSTDARSTRWWLRRPGQGAFFGILTLIFEFAIAC